MAGPEDSGAIETDDTGELQRGADRVARMILTSTFSNLDCVLAERELRMECLRLFPEKMELFDLVYAARFRRLREQFRS